MYDERALRVRLAEACRAAGVPGAALALLVDGVLLTAETGVVNVESHEPVTASTRFPILSITKGFTATLVLQLVDAGKLALDDPVVRYLPEFQLGGSSAHWTHAITVRHLLANTSGLPYVPFEEAGEGDDALERFLLQCQGVELIHQPGERFAYSNTGFVLAGLIIEQLYHQVWDRTLVEQLLQPFGMDETGSRLEQLGAAQVATNHQTAPSGVATPLPQWRPRAWGPAGSTMFATARDLGRFAALHLRPEWARLREPHVPVPGPHAEAWGLGWAVFGWGASVFGWDGVGPGMRTFFRVLPEHRAAVVLLTNSDTGRRVYRTLLPGLLAERFGVSMAQEAPPTVPLEDGPGDLARYVGVYQQPMWQRTVALSEDKATLVLDEDMPLLPTAQDGVFVQQDPNVDFPTVIFDGDFASIKYFGFRR